MLIEKFSNETDRNVISNAFKTAFERHNIPKEQQKDAKTWHNIRQEVSQSMFPRVTGRPVPMVNRGIKPTREIIKMAFSRDKFPGIYPWNAKTDKLKFAFLKRALARNEVSITHFKEFASVLDVKEAAIKKAIKAIMVNQFGGF